MPLAVFAETPLFQDEHLDERPELVTRYAGQNVQIADLTDRDLRRWSQTFRRNRTGKQTLDAFLRANRTFLLKDLDDFARLAITLEPVTTGGSVTRWRIPKSGDQGGDYPISGTETVRVGGSPVTVSSVDTDAREFILAAGVADTSVVDADYEYSRLVRVLQRPRWRRVSTVGPRFDGSIDFEEIPA